MPTFSPHDITMVNGPFQAPMGAYCDTTVRTCIVITVLWCHLCYCRSPWSNKYDPPLDDGAVPSDRLRRLETEANQAFDTYREL